LRVLRAFIGSVADGQGEKIDDKDGNRPAEKKIEEHERVIEEGDGLVEDMKEGEIHHDKAHNEQNDP
jgi:hypothetical protein